MKLLPFPADNNKEKVRYIYVYYNFPGLGFRPMPPDSHVESTLIWYKMAERNYAEWTTKLDEFLKRKYFSFAFQRDFNLLICVYLFFLFYFKT